ncbi:hypothetical protein SOV_40610 [Sporomusa ovata DSM 2662]|uniref:Uncharacterized protein n=1 Tax=Sporomusa ovata TaxID=2378 RepID=A0A0U1KUH1_9FIRM|nr:hypothetical protein [Sporomusa ovata]EQB26449.1 hypothetical protein SOV_3c03230 [Sporomusa ovata DSM 2662]CQR70533.1 hypothetical protein SpAn4DRAFT_1502 [Sporomusa ovata]
MKKSTSLVFRPMNLIAAFLIFYIILSSYSIYMVVYSAIAKPIQLGMLLLGFSTFLIHFSMRRIRIKMVLLPLVVYVVLLLASIFNGSDLYEVAMRFLRFVAVYYVVVVFAEHDIDVLKVLYQVIFAMAVFMLACYITFDLIAPDLGLSYYYNEPTSITTGLTSTIVYESRFGIYFRWATTSPLFGLQIPRCNGFSWEAGQYQMYLNYVLLYLLHIAKKVDWKKVAIIIVCLVSTFSAMGWLIAIIICSIWILRQRNTIYKWSEMIVCGIIGIYSGYQIIIEKMGSISYASRSSELFLLKDIFFKNNIFGTIELTQDMANSVLRFLWDYGYIAAALVVLIVVALIRNKKLFPDVGTKIVFSAWFFLSLFNEPIEYANITYLLVSMILVYKTRVTNIPKGVSQSIRS